MSIFESLEGFVWDEYNRKKIFEKHGVTADECEKIFVSEKYVLFDDIKHSQYERRFILLGFSENIHLMYVAFTIRNKRIRVVSARRAHKKEREFYEKTFKVSKI